MRIIAGEFGGRRIKVPTSGALRPTQDRVREALFNIIQGELLGARFLDLFAGSGAVGLEALSRGAAHAVFVEADRRHTAVISANAASLGCASRVGVVSADAYRFLASYSGEPFNIAFADPPYALGEEKGYDHVLQTLLSRNVIAEGGLFIAEMTSSQGASSVSGWELLRDRKYGKSRICLWRRIPVCG
jgi:16S rRNA (guanine966-N2)-methyltransferase